MPMQGSCSTGQNEERVYVTVPLRGTSPKQVDIQSADQYIKVSYPPYLLHVDLNDNIESAKGVARVEDGQLLLSFPKVERKMWSSVLLSVDDPASLSRDDRKQQEIMLRERRNLALERKRESEKERKIRTAEHSMHMEKLSTSKQMEQDERERNELEDKKSEEKEEAERQVYETFRTMNEQQQQQEQQEKFNEERKAVETKRIAKLKLIEKTEQLKLNQPQADTEDQSTASEQATETSATDVNDVDLNSISTLEVQTPNVDNDDIFAEDDVYNEGSTDNVATNETAEIGQEEEQQQQEQYEEVEDDEDFTLDQRIPKPRIGSKIKLEFTPRVFPTPMRESKKEEEELWILKNRRHLDDKMRKKLDGRDISERDPFWLKAKGDDFFKAGDFQSALSAYSCAVEIDPESIWCLSNRAACQLKLENYLQCIEDTTLVVNLVLRNAAAVQATDTVNGNVNTPPPMELAQFIGELGPKGKRRDRGVLKKALIRRGSAQCGAGDIHKALQDLQLARECDSTDPQLGMDCARVESIVRARVFKEIGDVNFKAKEYGKAKDAYGEALRINDGFVSCLSNRAACAMAQGQWESVVADCSTALQILDGLASTIGHFAIPAYQPKHGSEEWIQWKRRLLMRRGAAFFQQKDATNAEADYVSALKLDPANETIARDLARIQKARDEACLNAAQVADLAVVSA